jgi:branched-chain amino acid transport system substrate-binding protein
MNNQNLIIRYFSLAMALSLSLVLTQPAFSQEPVRIAFMDPLSGAFASIGNSGLKQLQFAADHMFNAKGGILGGRKIEIVPLDNQQSPTETQLQFRRAVSENLRIIFQGNSSAVANALNSTITRHNRRNPGQEILQINYSAVDPILTNDQCSFWHFRFDAHAIMKLNILTDYIAENPDIKKSTSLGRITHSDRSFPTTP